MWGNSAPSQPAASPVCRGYLVVSLATEEGPLLVPLLFACTRENMNLEESHMGGC